MEYGTQTYYASRVSRLEDAGGQNVRIIFMEKKGEIEEAIIDIVMPLAAFAHLNLLSKNLLTVFLLQ